MNTSICPAPKVVRIEHLETLNMLARIGCFFVYFDTLTTIAAAQNMLYCLGNEKNTTTFSRFYVIIK